MIPASVSAISRSRVGASTSSVRARISRSGQQSSRLNQAQTSPKADRPDSNPIMRGRIDPSTCPKIPSTILSPIASGGMTAM